MKNINTIRFYESGQGSCYKANQPCYGEIANYTNAKFHLGKITLIFLLVI